VAAFRPAAGRTWHNGAMHKLAWILCLALAVPAAAAADGRWYRREAAAMGTSVRVELWHADAAAAEAAMEAVLAEMRRVDALMSSFRPGSELSRINREAGARAVAVSPELFALIRRAQAISALSGGAFDITYASVGHLYNFRQGIAPDDGALEQALPAVDYRSLVLDPAARSVRFARPGMRIDLGGIAKGHAVDRAIALLRARGVREALVSAGGDTRILGDHHGRPWLTGIRDPRRPPGTSAVVLPLADTAISTSGDYERYFERDGVRYHHIISPRTGRPARAARSVTILGPDATTTDALSTTVFVLGPRAGLALVERLEGIEAVIIDAAGRVHYSSGLAPP